MEGHIIRLSHRFLRPGLLLIVILAVGIAGALLAASAGVDVTAFLVLGQPNFTSNAAGAGQAGLSDPRRIAIDTTVTPNHLYVVDFGNCRILGWNDTSSLTNARGREADTRPAGKMRIRGRRAA